MSTATPFPILVNGAWCASADPTGTFQATNPATGELLPGTYPVSGPQDVHAILTAAAAAKIAMRGLDAEVRAQFLETYAANLEAAKDALVAAANAETGLPVEPRLEHHLQAWRLAPLDRTTQGIQAGGQHRCHDEPGHRDARERMAHLLCEVMLRLQLVGLSDGVVCEFPLTQIDLGDATGLSTVHVNRTLQELRAAGLLDNRPLPGSLQKSDEDDEEVVGQSELFED